MKILSVMDPSFQNYGQVLGGYDVKELLATLDKVTPLPDAVDYVPEQAELMALPIAEELKNNAYGGVALSTPKVLGFDAYASYIAGRDFNETQVGVNKDILFNVGLNVNYHNFKPRHGGHHENAVGVGLNVRF